MKKLLTAAAIGVFVLVGATGCDLFRDNPAVEVEDCDAEDRRNKEAECGYSDADRKKLKTPTVKQPAKKKP